MTNKDRCSLPQHRFGMKMRAFAAALLASISIVVTALPRAAGAAPRTIQESDYRNLVDIGSPAISPDGKEAIALVSRIDWNDDKRKKELVMIDIATHAQRPLTYDRENLSEPTFAPNGKSIAFIADSGSGTSAKPQVWIMPFDGGDARPITNEKSGVLQYAWRPDSGAIAYTAAEAPPVRKGAARFRDSFVFTTQPIVDREPPHPVHLFVISVSGGHADQLTFGTRSVTSGEAQSTMTWSPDGKSIAVTLGPDPILNDESYSRNAIVDVATKHVRYLTSHTAWESSPLWSPDGSHIAYIDAAGDPQVNLVDLYVTTPAGGIGTMVSAPVDRTVDDAAWGHDGKSLFFSAPNQTTLDLYRATIGGGLARVDLGNLIPQSELNGAIGPDDAMLFVASATKQPPELYYRSPAGAISRLTDYNAAIAQLDLGDAQRITYHTTLGIDGDGVLFTPPGFTANRRYPLVVYIHGGPTGSSMESFDFYAQVMAARGWLVLRPNYRGSDNLGLAYQRAVFEDPDAGPGKDIMAAVGAVRARGIVDSKRIAVSGWSYGGIMTAWMISAYHIWAAAVSGASVNDWITDYGTADDSLADVDLFRGSPFVDSNAADWNRVSAIWYAKDVTTPVLILSDVGDNRDPFATSSMYWRALRDNHKDATLRVWPIDGHFPSDPVRTADVYHYWIGYIAQHFK
jgi:dipeptidyl aminopeptidase/acylaminoacyl peptidase